MIQVRNSYGAPEKETLWQRLGFGEPYMPWTNTLPGFDDKRTALTTVMHFGFKDRLRILLTGHVMTKTSMQGDVLPSKMECTTRTGVLPPPKVYHRQKRE